MKPQTSSWSVFDLLDHTRWAQHLQALADRPFWNLPWVMPLAFLLCAVPLLNIVTLPLSPNQQAVFAVACFLAAMWLNRIEGRPITLALIVMSVLVSTRYMYWRITQSVSIGGPNSGIFDAFFAIGLILAELYAYTVLLLGYFQVLWPLQRKPVPMPRAQDDWPTVDIYIPTYNEPLKVVKPTIMAALSIDWPRDKVRVYVLDDGRREEFRKYCESIGATHITRTDSKHAKAGNLNRAMQKTTGEYIAIFDCDHVPTRSFLQVTVGWFLRDPKLGMLQTPHHFFSPDPFERNLGTFRKVPNEGELFYGLLQDGNDFWNATFFCGSCAVLRRTALAEVGGIAVETVTEDAHTALKMHRRGWNTAYINLPQAAGLATESLSAHVGQRIRWARGMAQIFRIDNPLFGRGLNLGQRLCYLNAMLHFFYGLPRLVFLTAPLSYLFFEAHIINAAAMTIFVYALPHIAHANMTNSRLQGPFRHSFWAEVYETVLATYILMPTTLALINPKLGTFNVTAKGGLIDRDYFDRDIAKPYLMLLGINLIGFMVGVCRFIWWNTHELDTVVLNMVWTIYNLIIIGAALAVAWESRQVRRSIRVNTEIPVRLRVEGHAIAGTSIDLSEGGVALRTVEPVHTAVGEIVEVALAPDFREVWIPARVTRAGGTVVAMQFAQMNQEQEKQLVYAIFGRANAWMDWAAKRPVDDVIESFQFVLNLGLAGGARMMSLLAGSTVNTLRKGLRYLLPRTTQGGGKAAGLLMSAVGAAAVLMAAAPIDGWAQARTAATESPATVEGTTAAALAPGQATQKRVLSFQQLGQQRPIRLRGVQGELGIPVAVRDDEIVTRARLHLKFSHSPSLIFPLSHLNILVNSELAATIPLSAETASGAERIIDIDPRLFIEYNQIGLQMIAHYTLDCEDPIHTTLWSIISNQSTLELETKPLAIKNDLNLLPAPFFDNRDSRELTLPFVFPTTPTPDELEAAGVVASWFGAMASYRGAKFPVYVGELPASHAVVFSAGGRLPEGLSLQQSGGARVSLVDNPKAFAAKLLVVSGTDGQSLNMAARALALGGEALTGDSTVIRELTEPDKRLPYDAPRWIPTDRPVKFGELVPNWQLEVSGLYPDTVRVPFHVPPDLFTWHSDGLKLDLRYRYTPTVGSKSTLNVNVNNEFVEAIALSYTGEEKASEDRINLPFVAQYDSINHAKVFVPDYKFGADNTLQFQYYFERKAEGACKDVVLDNLRGAIDADSTIDLTKYPHFTFLPDLTLFANGGFPFTRFADLSETAVILPERITPPEIEAYLVVMGKLGASTGYPAIRFKIGRAADVEQFADDDILVIGAAANQPLLERWQEDMPMTVISGLTQLRVIGPVERLRAKWENRDIDAAREHAGRIIQQAGSSLGAVMSFESPLSSKRTVVLITAGDGARLTDVAEMLTDTSKSQFISGDLVLLNGTELNHYSMGEQYSVGSLPFLLGIRWWLSHQPLFFLLMTLGVVLLLALVIYHQLRRMAIARKEG
jgi:cellulose synthase (UDP-forming)